MNTTTKLNRRERKAAQLLRHYATCEALGRYLGMDAPDGKKISVALFKVERDASNAATAQCNGEIYAGQPFRNDGDWLLFTCKIKMRVIAALGKLPPGFFVNGDPRGYSCKVDNDSEEGRKLIEAVGLHRDLGGYGILSPEIDGN